MLKKIILMGAVLCSFMAFTACSSSKGIEVSKKPFPEMTGTDLLGNEISNELFSGYEATIVNFWNNGCGTCIEEMPELEDYYNELKEQNIHLIGIASDAGESEEKLAFAKEIIDEKGVTYPNIVPDIEGDFYKTFIEEITGYPITYIVDGEGNIIGAPIIGNVKNQDEKLRERLKGIIEEE